VKAEVLFDVRGLAALVTGGAAGLGRACAEVMAANSADVAVIDRDRVRMDATVAALRASGQHIEAYAVDVTDRAALTAAIDDAAAKFGRLDVIFANAGISAGPGFLSPAGARQEAGAIEAIAHDLWHKTLSTNLMSVVSTISAAVPHMKARGGGRIIVTASIGALRPAAIVGTPYGVSKAAVAHLVKQAALELARYGITVNAILPGPFRTDLTTPDLEEVFSRASPMHRVADPDEIKGVALLLASPASRYITGAHMVIDGGAMLGRAD
jgi:NAD(P)-dependent dehydrogenase (short-subunit alcohol dehydrogenase family)